MTLQNMCTRVVADDVCYQESIRNNLFVITNKGKVAYIQSSNPHIGSHLVAGIGVVEWLKWWYFPLK